MATLITYFSAEGTTAKVAKDYAQSINADVFEIVPKEPYTKADINYINPISRCNREQLGGRDVPVEGSIENFDKYDTVYIGFPIWYGYAPNVVSTFCKAYDWSGKKVYIFATSGSSGIGKTAEKLQPYISGAKIMDARRISSAAELSDWENA